MNRRSLGSLAVFLGALIGATVATAADPADDAKAFFNGKSLDGWEGLTQYWKVTPGMASSSAPKAARPTSNKPATMVADGAALVGSSEPNGLRGFNTFLCSKRTYKDFELKFQVRLKDGKGNSGVQIRSQVIDKEKFVVRGPQCDMGQQYWGSLYGEQFGGMMKASEAEAVKRVVKPAEFNDYTIKCVGKHVTITINGSTMVDGEFPKMPDEGIIAWQLHQGGPMEVTFRKIEFREIK